MKMTFKYGLEKGTIQEEIVKRKEVGKRRKRRGRAREKKGDMTDPYLILLVMLPE